MEKYYVGLGTSFHDPAIAVVDSSGRVVFAEATDGVNRDRVEPRALLQRPLERPPQLLDEVLVVAADAHEAAAARRDCARGERRLFDRPQLHCRLQANTFEK